jgi:hypothetical protein
MASEHDNRIQLPPTAIDFLNQVGETGQAHDDFPMGGTQPRYDWMRLYLIGLLSLQSSNDPPSQYRTGTLWYRRSDNSILIWNGTDWVDLAHSILLRDSITDSTSSTLADFYTYVMDRMNSILPRCTFSGKFVNSNPTSIPVPAAIQTKIENVKNLMKPELFVNGLLIDPRLYQFSASCPLLIELTAGIGIVSGDKFTVIIEGFDVFVSDEVLA